MFPRVLLWLLDIQWRCWLAHSCSVVHFLVLTFVFALFSIFFFHFILFFIVEIKSSVASPPPPAIQSASCRDRLLSYSLFNWSGLKGVLHKAAESTAGVCVSGVRAKFSKSSQCVPQWQHMLESLQRNSRTHNLTCEDTTRHTGTVRSYCDGWTRCTDAHVHTCLSRKCAQMREMISRCI